MINESSPTPFEQWMNPFSPVPDERREINFEAISSPIPPLDWVEKIQVTEIGETKDSQDKKVIPKKVIATPTTTVVKPLY